MMKVKSFIAGIALASAFTSFAAETNSVASTAPTPDLLTTCPVSGDKIGGDMGKPYVFTYENQEVKLCCASCKEDFDKDPAKFIAKIRAADKK